MWYVADFETTSAETYDLIGETRVWLWAICDQDSKMVGIGTDIESFLDKCKELNHSTIYFHNLKFDGSFIVDYLLRLGYIHYPELPKDVKKGFTSLIDENGVWYSIKLYYTRTQYVTFLDSLKLLPFSVDKIAKDFKLPILKLKIDYSNYEVTEEKILYIQHDVQIVAMALKQIKAEGMTRMTTASSAYHQYSSKQNRAWFKLNNPELPLDFLTEWRDAYRGGRCQVNPLYKAKKLKKVYRYDINSMYPYIMRHCMLPYGEPIECSYPNDYHFSLIHCRIEFMLKEGHIPTLLRKSGRYGEDSYYVATDDIEELHLSNIDLELVFKHYNVTHFEVIKCYGFYCTNLAFGEYINYWYTRKQQDSGAKKVVDKLMLNSLYGKFGSNVMRASSLPYIGDKDSVSFNKSDPVESTHYYLPKAIAVTSYAHKLIDDAIEATGYTYFVYCDTDSVHTLGRLPDSMIHQTELGKFKLESVEEQSKYLRQKCYLTQELEDGKLCWKLTVAGMPDRSKNMLLNELGDYIIDYFNFGLTVGGKLLPHRVKGGTILRETQFTINP